MLHSQENISQINKTAPIAVASINMILLFKRRGGRRTGHGAPGWTVGPGAGGWHGRCPHTRVVVWACAGSLGPGLRQWRLFCELSPVGSEVRTQRPHSCACPIDILTEQTSLTTQCPALNPRLPISHFPQGHGPLFSGST